MLVYKIDIMESLKKNGWNSTRLYSERPISQDAVQKIRKNEMIGIKTLDRLCALLDMQPGDIIGYAGKEEELQIVKNYFEYKNYIGKIDMSVEERTFFGKIHGINDLVTFEGESFAELENAFHKAVDDYLEFCEERGK